MHAWETEAVDLGADRLGRGAAQKVKKQLPAIALIGAGPRVGTCGPGARRDDSVTHRRDRRKEGGRGPFPLLKMKYFELNSFFQFRCLKLNRF